MYLNLYQGKYDVLLFFFLLMSRLSIYVDGKGFKSLLFY